MNTKLFAIFGGLVLLAAMLGLAAVGAAETRDIVILGTSDIHGNVDNYDYFTDSVPTGSSSRGLTRVETYVKSVLASNPYTILIDNGDTIQGTPLAYYFGVLHPEFTNPLATAMNYMGYAASTVGNHEFNYGSAVLNKFKSEANFPLLSANVTGCRDYTFEPYRIVDMNGVQVGILGLTPPAVIYWEKPENIVGCVFGDAMAAANYYVPTMRAAGADVIIVAAHSGLDETYGYGREENFVKYLANEVPGIDVILAGHAHANVASQVINGVLVTEPNYHTRNISDIRITVDGSGTDWVVTAKSSTTPAVGSTAEDPDVKALTQPYHDATVTYINTPIATATDAFPGGFPARIADGPMADLINRVQMEAAAAAGFPVEASCAALFTNSAKIDPGPIRLKDAYAAYIYDNTFYVIEATGQQIKDELEWTANYFNQYHYEPAGVTVNSAARDYNYDMWSGIEYKLDVTKPLGERVVELRLGGEALAMDRVVRVALNNYRATGRFPTAPKIYQSTTEVRDLVVDWITARGTISPSDVFVLNWALLPPFNTWHMFPHGMAAGFYHTVGLKSDGTLLAAGRGIEGQLNVASWTGILQVAAGDFHTVGLKFDGTVVATGDNAWGQIGVNSWTSIVQVAAGDLHTLGLKSDGTVVAVGRNDSGQLEVGSWTDIVQIAGGRAHTVGLKADGTVVGAGWNGYGQLDVGLWRNIVQVSAGENHTVGLKADGTVLAVGWDNAGQLGVNSWSGIVQVATGQYHTAGLKSDGTVVAVGNNGEGQLQVGSWTGIVQVAAGGGHTEGLKSNGTVMAVGNISPVDDWNLGPSIRVKPQVTAGEHHTVGLKSDGTVVAMGANNSGQTNVLSWCGIIQVAAGYAHTVGLKSDGTVVSVGDNTYGQQDGVSSWSGIVQVAAGGGHTVGLKSDGTVVAVGWNAYGQRDVGSWTNIVQVAAGGFHTVGLKSDGTVVAVGMDYDGSLNVSSWTGIVQVATGDVHTLGLRSDGTVVAVGSNNNGQLDVGSWVGIVQVAAGMLHTAGLKGDGSVVAVGENRHGQMDVNSWSNIVQVTAGVYHTVGLRYDGTVLAVGYNSSGQANVATWKLGQTNKAKSDFNRDGKEDLVWRNPATGRTTIWYMEGATWNGGYADILPELAGPEWGIVGIADFNNDANPDLLWRNNTTGRTTIWYMNGSTWNGGYADVEPTLNDPAWSIVGIADFNRDGSPDLLWRNSSTGRTTIWYMTGPTWNGGYADVEPTLNDASWSIVGVADFNGDSNPDLLWRNSADGRATIWYMTGPVWNGGYAEVLPTLNDPNWAIVAVRDFNLDGSPDLLWRNTSNVPGDPNAYRTTVWYMDGPVWNGNWGDLLPVVSDPNWIIIGK